MQTSDSTSTQSTVSKEAQSPSSKKWSLENQHTAPLRNRWHNGKKPVAQEVQTSRFGCDDFNIYSTALSDQLRKKIKIYVDVGAAQSWKEI